MFHRTVWLPKQNGRLIIKALVFSFSVNLNSYLSGTHKNYLIPTAADGFVSTMFLSFKRSV